MARRDHGGTRAPSQRQLRVGEEVRHALAWILRRGGVRDPELEGIPLTVTEVRASPDLRNATAFVIRMGSSAEETRALIPALKRAAPFLKREVARRVHLRVAPDLSFQADLTFDEASRIDALLHDPHVSQDLSGDMNEDPED